MKENIYDCMNNSGMGPNHLMKKKYKKLSNSDFIFGYSNLVSFCRKVNIKVSWAHRFFQMAHQNFKWPIKILMFAFK